MAAVTAKRSIIVNFSAGFVANNTFAAADNAASPAEVEIKSLAAGNNTITCPGGGATITAVTIIPPTGNLQTLTLKGVAGDTGINMHKTDPTTIALDSAVASFVINAGGIVTGIRFIWS